MENNEVYDLIGIGFGPSNLALAVAIDEQCDKRNFKAIFLEQKNKFSWHPDMLISGTAMQISFLKDLVTQRNPSSPYTFISYLKQAGRLPDFINLRQFHPSRIEFNKYLAWTAEKLAEYTKYGCKVLKVQVHDVGARKIFEIVHQDIETGIIERIYAKNIVVAPGGKPSLPISVAADGSNKRIWHSSQYLQKIEAFKEDINAPYHFAVVGRGQSSAEIAFDLHSNFPNAKITCIFRGFSLKPADSSEFVNEVFSPGFVDFIHQSNPELHTRIIDEHNDTNYAVVDAELITKLYQICYAEKVIGAPRLMFRSMTSVESASESMEGVNIALSSLKSDEKPGLEVSAAIFATGYTYPNPPEVLSPLRDVLVFNPNNGHANVDRHYRVQTSAGISAGIYIQGCNEQTHGLGDTLLSNLATRADEILNDLIVRNTVDATQHPLVSGGEIYEVEAAA